MLKKIFLSLSLLLVIDTCSANAITPLTAETHLNNFNAGIETPIPVKDNNNQIALAIGANSLLSNDHYSGGGDAGLNLGLEYTHNFNKNIGFFVGANTSVNFLGGMTTAFLTTAFTTSTTTIDLNYATAPLALQFTLPMGNNEIFTRVGANVFSLEETTTHFAPNKPQGTETKETKNGVGFYGAIGWQYNFGFTPSHNWSIGLNYQFYKMKQYNINQYILNFGYRF